MIVMSRSGNGSSWSFPYQYIMQPDWLDYNGDQFVGLYGSDGPSSGYCTASLSLYLFLSVSLSLCISLSLSLSVSLYLSLSLYISLYPLCTPLCGSLSVPLSVDLALSLPPHLFPSTDLERDTIISFATSASCRDSKGGVDGSPVYLGLVGVMHTLHQTIDNQFALSSDGVSWWRPARRPNVPLLPLGEYGGGLIWSV